MGGGGWEGGRMLLLPAFYLATWCQNWALTTFYSMAALVTLGDPLCAAV